MFVGVLVTAFGAFADANVTYIFDTPKECWYIAVAGIAVVGLGWSGLTSSWTFGLLFAALFTGGAAQLWMTDPLWFPALRFHPKGGFDFAMIAMIFLQGLITAGVLFKTGALSGMNRLLDRFGTSRILIFLALSAAFCVSPLGFLSYGGYSAYVRHLIAGAVMIGLNMATVAAMLRVKSPGLAQNTFHPLVPALFASVTAGILAWLAFEGLPHVEDEVAFLFQARTFAGGALSVPALPEATLPGLEHYLLEVRDDRWFATTPPGWPALLSLGVIIGLPWLINPILTIPAILLAHNIAKRQTNSEIANLVALLMAASPWLLGTAASMMPHMITLTLTLFAWWALLHSRDKGAANLRWALLAGLAMGWIFATRQLEALILGTLTGLWLLTLYRDPKGIPRIIFYSLGCILAGGLYLVFNYAMTGDALLDPLKRYLEESWGKGANGYGFGDKIGPPSGWGALDLAPGHSLFEAIVNLINNITALSIETFGWGAGSLTLFWIYILYAKPSRFEQAMMAVAALTIAALFFYWFSGSFYIGPRYWFSAFFPLIILSARGFVILQSKLETLKIPKDSSGVVLLVLCLFGTAVFTSWRGVEKYFEYGNFHGFPRAQLATGDLADAIVFFDPETVDYGSAFNENDPWQTEGTPLFIRDMGAEINTAVINALPGRPVVYLKKEE